MMEKLKLYSVYTLAVLAGLAFGWLLYESNMVTTGDPACLTMRCIKIIK